jgi:hypothetical protein
LKIDRGDFTTDIYLTPEEMKRLCKPGAGADTCIWLLINGRTDGDNFECSYYHKPMALLDRWKAGLTVAKRDGCDEVKKLEI